MSSVLVRSLFCLFTGFDVTYVSAEENQKRYAENDERIKSSPIIKELLERSKKNKEKYNFYSKNIDRK